MTRTVTVIGGGPAGMAAALFASRGGAQVTLLERNEKLGKKLYITGKGRCNVTNTAENPMESIPRNPRFLHSAFAFWDAKGLRALLAEHGCPTKEERGGRVFPASDKASDVTRALEKALRLAGVDIRLHTRVPSLAPVPREGPVIWATGGASYPATGSTGDGYALARALGHTVFPPRPSLIPLTTKEAWPRALAGLSLKNVRLSARAGKKVLFDGLGEMLFTHFGVSGPLVLSMSSHILDADLSALAVYIDMKPGLSPEQMDRRLTRDLETNPRKRLGSILPGLVPARMANFLPDLCGVDGAKTAAQISRLERQALGVLLKALPLPIAGFRPLEEAIITRGGIDVREIDPKTMMSRKVPGVFFAGELLDVDAHTGGYNLQIAFSTGALAGWSAARQSFSLEG
ncbi:MAG: NAD(P)/FAD-dependent oxidoreductase [Firmicutes bacterium]|nr:NAD(P)/FAD-dependent oxidoreductase [Bacillota bacterium]